MKYFITSLILLIACAAALAQKRGSAVPAASSAPNSASGSTSLIQGYHYVLPKKYHVAYRSVLYTSPDAVDSAGKRNKHTYYTYFIISTTDPFRAADLTKFNSGPKGKLLDLDHLGKEDSLRKTDEDVFAKILRTGFLNMNVHEGWARIVIDTLWRYSDEREHVSITQSDSGKLIIQFHNKLQGLKQRVEAAATQRNIKLLSRILVKAPPPVNSDTLVKHFSNAIKVETIDIKVYKDFTANAAIPIKDADSSQNFYLKIKNKVQFEDPIYFLRLPYSVWQYGATTIPFRYRFGNASKKVSLQNASKVATEYPAPSEATGNISLAAYLGKKFGATRFFYDATKSHNTASLMFSAFAGPTLIPLSANNIESGKDLNNYPSQLLALSYGVSCTVELGVLNLGFFGGIDHPLQHSPWVYANRPWLGFGIGFNLGMLSAAGNIGYN